MAYADAVSELFQKPLAEFIAERKRLAGELKAAGDKTGARVLGQLSRPPISAWTVNQLWWKDRKAFDKLLETAERLRDGDLAGTAPHREALAAMRAKAATILTDGGHNANEATLRRITTTLSALAATGSWDPDPPGALTDDRDPPGFEAAGIPGLAASVPAAKARDDDDDDGAAKRKKADADDKRAKAAEETREKAEASAARRRAEEAHAKKLAERHRHEAALRTARGDVERRERELERLRKATEEAEAALEKSKAIAADLEAKLEELAE